VIALVQGHTLAVMPGDERAAAVAGLADERPNFLAFVRSHVASAAVAEDILQATFARALERIDTLRDLEAARAWFYRSLRNAITDHHRRSAVTEHRLVAVARESEAAMIDEFASNACACIGEAVDRLGPNYRHTIHRVHVEGLPLDAYAREAGITRGNAAVRLHRARKALHAEVKACCGGCADAGCRDCICSQPSDPLAKAELDGTTPT
jgi:RNA polymerase sigma factor (sigma-70 family)